MCMKKTLAMLMALSMTFAVSSVDVSALDFDSISAQVKAADEASNDFNITIKNTEVKADGVVMRKNGYAQLTLNFDNENERDYTQCAVMDKDGKITVPYFHYEPNNNWGTWGDDVIGTGFALGLGEYYVSTEGVLFDQRIHTNKADKGTGGYYALDGTTLVEPQYDLIGIMNDGIAVTANLGTYTPSISNGSSASAPTQEYNFFIINKEGETLYTSPTLTDPDCSLCFGMPSEGLIPFASNIQFDSFENIDKNNDIHSHCGYIDYQGNVVLSFSSDKNYLGAFSDGLAWVINNEYGYGYIDKTGEFVIPAEYNGASAFHDGIARVSKAVEGSYQYGYINKENEIVIPFEYDDMETEIQKDDIFFASKDGAYGYINLQNETVIPFEYDSAYGSDENDTLFTVGKGGKYGIVDKNNNIVVPLIFDDISNITNHTAYAVSDQNVYILQLSENSTLSNLGNVNGDEEVNAKDAAAVLVEAASLGAGNGSTFTEEQTKFADVNGDDTVNAKDGAEILVYAASHGAGDFSGTMEEFISQKNSETVEPVTVQ